MAKKQKPPGDKNNDGKDSPENVASIREGGVTRTINLDKPDEFSPEDIASLTKAFGVMFQAGINGNDIEDYVSPDDFKPAVADKVADAIQKYRDAGYLDLARNIHANQDKLDKLFHPKTLVEANGAYRAMVKEGHYRFVGNEDVFGKYRGYKGVIDKDAIEQCMRRVDVEIRNMDTFAREELLFNFVNAILGSDFANARTPLVTSDQFEPASAEARELLRDLVLLYTDVHEHAKISYKGQEHIVRDFNIQSIAELVEIPLMKGTDYPVRVEYAHIARAIRAKNYYLILQLIRALSGALPTKVQEVVQEALWTEKGVEVDVSLVHGRFINPSKYLRKAFIAISRGHGSFETFFTALHDLQQLLDNELNNKVRTAHGLVAVYDSLGLDIADVLKSSTKRILDEPPF